MPEQTWKPPTEQEYQRDQEQRYLGKGGIDLHYLRGINRKWSVLRKKVMNGSLK